MHGCFVVVFEEISAVDRRQSVQQQKACSVSASVCFENSVICSEVVVLSVLCLFALTGGQDVKIREQSNTKCVCVCVLSLIHI